jgi:hypothetical protein
LQPLGETTVSAAIIMFAAPPVGISPIRVGRKKTQVNHSWQGSNLLLSGSQPGNYSECAAGFSVPCLFR